jgi:hypothetical protein
MQIRIMGTSRSALVLGASAISLVWITPALAQEIATDQPMIVLTDVEGSSPRPDDRSCCRGLPGRVFDSTIIFSLSGSI